MQVSLRFYVDGPGFTIKRQWIPDQDAEYPADGNIRWCWLELDDAAIMLQEFTPQRRPKDPLGTSISRNFTGEDALALYCAFKLRGVQTRSRPSVGMVCG